MLELARRAHATAFSDHVVIGWEIAVLDDGPRLVEGNKGPDLDLVQTRRSWRGRMMADTGRDGAGEAAGAPT